MSIQPEWPEQYLRECVADEIELAARRPERKFLRFAMPADLTRETNIFPVSAGNTVSPGRSRTSFSSQDRSALPRWRRDWRAAGPLATLLGLTIVHDKDEGTVSVGGGSRRRNATERYRDHPSEDAATLAAIVRAAIAELEARAGQ